MGRYDEARGQADAELKVLTDAVERAEAQRDAAQLLFEEIDAKTYTTLEEEADLTARLNDKRSCV